MTIPIPPYKVTTICGSMRFYPAMLKLAERLTLEGEIVLMPFVRKDAFMEASTDHPGNVAENLDRMHIRKSDMADRIAIVTDERGYIGDSTRKEMVYAMQNQKFHGLEDTYAIGENL